MEYGELKGQLSSFLTSTVDGGKWTILRPPATSSGGKHPNTHYRGEWVGARAGLDALKKRKTSCTGRESHCGRLCPPRNLVPLRTELQALAKLENSNNVRTSGTWPGRGFDTLSLTYACRWQLAADGNREQEALIVEDKTKLRHASKIEDDGLLISIWDLWNNFIVTKLVSSHHLRNLEDCTTRPLHSCLLVLTL
jgi:hypothetical protein